MINTPIVISDDFTLFSSNVFLNEQELLFSVSIHTDEDFKRINLPDLHKLSPLIKHHHSFSFCFDFSQLALLKNALTIFKETIIQFFFYPRYKIIDNTPLVIVTNAGNFVAEVEHVIRETEQYFFSQGFDGIKVMFFEDKKVDSETDILFSEKYFEVDEVYANYRKLLMEGFYCAKFVAIDHKKAAEVVGLLREAEKKIESENPLLFKRLIEYKRLTSAYASLTNKFRITEKDRLNQNEYLRIIKEQNEAGKINTFYHYEYEVLPLWYKQFGHVIKVLTGKRSLRSLFDNNVRKYKE